MFIEHQMSILFWSNDAEKKINPILKYISLKIDIYISQLQYF